MTISAVPSMRTYRLITLLTPVVRRGFRGDARHLSRTARTSRRSGPNRRRSSRLGYGAYRPTLSAPTWPPPRATRSTARAAAAGRTRARPAAPGSRRVDAEAEADARRTRGEARPAKPAAKIGSRTQNGRSRTCGSQSQACTDGSRKMSAKPFVATTSSEISSRTRSAAVCPASSSSRVTGGAGSAGRGRRASRSPRARRWLRAHRAASDRRARSSAESGSSRPWATRRARRRAANVSPTNDQKNSRLR